MRVREVKSMRHCSICDAQKWTWQVTCRCGYKSGWHSSLVAHLISRWHTFRRHPHGLNTIAAKDELCPGCLHKREYHDGAGCTDQMPDGSPCLCLICIDMPGDEPRTRDRINTIAAKEQL